MADPADDPPASPPPALGIFVLVVDGLRPSEVGELTPNLSAFRREATWYPESRSVFTAETIPNHVAMMTGVYPERSGISSNNFWDRTGTPESRDLSDPSELQVRTLFTILAEECPDLTTAAVLSKKYLYEIFSAGGVNLAPDLFWDPRPTNLPSPDEHSLDLITMPEALTRLPDADFMFVNLGDVDRSGHIDATGATGLPVLRTAVLVQTDALVGQFLDALRAAGRWERSVVFIVSDHGFDFSLPTSFVNLQPLLPPGVSAIQSGGTDHLYLEDGNDPAGPAKLAAARAVALANPGVADAWYREPNPIDPDPAGRLPEALHANHENLGDLVVNARLGWRFSDPLPISNPIPGNHGHVGTRRNTFMVGGGAPFVRRGQVIEPSNPDPSLLENLPEQSENVDIAPTVLWLLGRSAAQLVQGRILDEAFTTSASPSSCGVL